MRPELLLFAPLPAVLGSTQSWAAPYSRASGTLQLVERPADSPFRPVWEYRGRGGRVYYVDQSGRVLKAPDRRLRLPRPRRGQPTPRILRPLDSGPATAARPQ